MRSPRDDMPVAGPPVIALPRRVAAISVPGAVVLGGLMAVSAAAAYYLTRGTAFWFDEWSWALQRRAWTFSAFLKPHNNHLSLVPVTLYKLLFVTVGIGDYGPYRALAIAAHLVVVALVYRYARVRIGPALAVCAAALVLLDGPGWQDVLWPFQMAWLISLGSGLGALMALDREDRRGRLLACGLVAVSLASSGIGIVMAIGVGLELVSRRGRWRELWILAGPVLLYALWWVTYQTPSPSSPLRLIPKFVANEASATMGALFGANAPHPSSPLGSPALVSVGRPLAAIALIVLIWRLVALRRLSPRVLALLGMLAAFWGLTAYTRASLFFGTQAWASRYLYVGVLLIVLLAVELARGVELPWVARLVVGAAVIAIGLSNFATYRDAAFDLRTWGQMTRANLGSLELARPVVARGYVVRYLPGFPFVLMRADAYFAMARSIGTPADSAAQLAAAPEYARTTADGELLAMGEVTVRYRRSGGATGLSCTALSGGAIPPGDAELRTGAGRATVYARRFGDELQDVGSVAPFSVAAVRVRRDLGLRPWQVQVRGAAPVTVCGLR